jgi:hypothetical protein
MGHNIYYQAFYWVIRFSSYIHQAKLGIHSSNSAWVVIGYLHYLDGRDYPY